MIRRHTAVSITSTLLLSAWLAGCNKDSRGANEPTTPATEASGTDEVTSPSSAPEQGQLTRAEAELTAAEGAELEGKATFTQEPDGVRVVLELDDAPPGPKGVHVHTKGDCSDIKGQSMGPHFAPNVEQHGLPSEGEARHLGDLGNIVVADDGEGRLEIKVPNATLKPDDTASFLGRALVVHTGEDTGSAVQPSGGSGTPMACGVIKNTGG
jgi:superoxide dismutase, Cu-Zn family